MAVPTTSTRPGRSVQSYSSRLARWASKGRFEAPRARLHGRSGQALDQSQKSKLAGNDPLMSFSNMDSVAVVELARHLIDMTWTGSYNPSFITANDSNECFRR